MDDELFIIWTSDNLNTAEQMVFLYSLTAIKKKWWKKITIVIWGSSAQLANRNPKIQSLIKKALEANIRVSACSVCADQLGALTKLKELGVELKPWGEEFTEIIKAKKHLLTI